MAKKTKAELVAAAVAKGIPADESWSWKDLKAAVDAATSRVQVGLEPQESDEDKEGIAITETITITVSEDLVPTRNVTSKRLPQVIRLPHRGHIHL